MNIKEEIYRIAGFLVRRLKLYNYFELKDDSRPAFPVRLVFLCGREGIRYLNACMVSIYRHWDELPDICVVTDGTPLEMFQKDLIRWPRKLEIISWEECALYFSNKGQQELYNFANQNILGRKFASLLYFALQGPFLYSDTDILWFDSPGALDLTKSPLIKMSRENDRACYSDALLKALGEEKCLLTTPFNSGLMFLNGDFSSYPKWKELCQFLGTLAKDEIMAEQTAFAILTNHFDQTSFWPSEQILIKTDDMFHWRYTRSDFPNILARHYVYTRPTAFWRDFIYMCATKNSRKL